LCLGLYFLTVLMLEKTRKTIFSLIFVLVVLGCLFGLGSEMFASCVHRSTQKHTEAHKSIRKHTEVFLRPEASFRKLWLGCC